MYLVWRKLGISIDEWNSLPWWQQQVVLDGMEREANEQSGSESSSGSTQSSKGDQEADILDMDRFEALTKGTGAKAKGFGGGAKK